MNSSIVHTCQLGCLEVGGILVTSKTGKSPLYY